ARIVMAQPATSRPAGLTAIAVLALVQAGVGVFMAVRWFSLAGQLGERGAILLPLAGALVFLRAVFALIIALLYLAFVVGAFKRRDWAWGVGMLAVVLNLIGAAALILTGDTVGPIAARTVVAIVIFAYLVSPAGRSALGSATPR
ncbi:MAG TPA: hypothetical protein VIX40_04820, partial [Methylomirabilota bacterium]